MNFNQPTALTVRADGSEPSFFTDLPPATTFVTEQLPNGATSSWLEGSGSFEATFNPAGEYRFTLSADGYDTLVVVITATEVPQEPDEDPVIEADE